MCLYPSLIKESDTVAILSKGKLWFFFFCQSILFFHVVLIKAIPSFVDFHYICRVLKLTFTLLQLVSNYQLAPPGISSTAVYPLYLHPEVSRNARVFWSIIPPESSFCNLLSATSLSISSKHAFPSSLRFWSPSILLLSARSKNPSPSLAKINTTHSLKCLRMMPFTTPTVYETRVRHGKTWRKSSLFTIRPRVYFQHSLQQLAS